MIKTVQKIKYKLLLFTLLLFHNENDSPYTVKNYYPSKYILDEPLQLLLCGENIFILYTQKDLEKNNAIKIYEHIMKENKDNMEQEKEEKSLPKSPHSRSVSEEEKNFKSKSKEKKLNKLAKLFKDKIKSEKNIYLDILSQQISFLFVEAEAKEAQIMLDQSEKLQKNILKISPLNKEALSHPDYLTLLELTKKFRKATEITIGCGHTVNTSKLKEEAHTLKKKMDKGPLQLKCPTPTCGYLLNDFDLILGLGGKYNEFTSNYLCGIDTPTCMVCAIQNETVICLHQSHFICEKCLRNYFQSLSDDKIKHKKTSNKILIFSQCPARNCRFVLSGKILEKYLDDSRKIKIYIIYEKAEIKEKCVKCIFDLQDIPISEAVSLYDCDHFICKTCLLSYVKSLDEKLAGIRDIVCPCKTCYTPINYYVLEEYIPRDLLERFENRGIERVFDILHCAHCQKAIGEKDKKIKTVYCPYCGNKTCSWCSEPAHEGECVARKKRIAMLKQSGNKIALCPKCPEICCKDSHCDRVTCEKCRTEFCFECSALQNPIDCHDNSYHRRFCAHYVYYEGYDEKFHPRCVNCRNKRVLCCPPGDLINGEIPK